MPRAIITVENLSKRYIIGHRGELKGHDQHTNFRDIIGREIWNAARKAADLVRGRQVIQGDTLEEFWALKDVSFEVQQGEVLGIIGRNGAGKSTLLKILSRITEPTSGKITLRGRVASLLEVGTGFHPELSGRENIYLNGAILGMSRAEINRKFDEIVAFAEVEKFLDTPVKRYSSGMYVRLAFAVAAHLEPEILVVDEVLAVGDAEFQKKCLGKMNEVSRREGRTVLFVSHNLPAVTSLCQRVLLLSQGELVYNASAPAGVELYFQLAQQRSIATSGNDTRHLSAEIVDRTGKPTSVLVADTEAYIEFTLDAKRLVHRCQFAITIFNANEIGLVSSVSPQYAFNAERKKIFIRMLLPTCLLNNGWYRIEGAVFEQDQILEQSDNLICFNILRNSGFDQRYSNSKGLIRIDSGWIEKPVCTAADRLPTA